MLNTSSRHLTAHLNDFVLSSCSGPVTEQTISVSRWDSGQLGLGPSGSFCGPSEFYLSFPPNTRKQGLTATPSQESVSPHFLPAALEKFPRQPEAVCKVRRRAAMGMRGNMHQNEKKRVCRRSAQEHRGPRGAATRKSHCITVCLAASCYCMQPRNSPLCE